MRCVLDKCGCLDQQGLAQAAERPMMFYLPDSTLGLLSNLELLFLAPWTWRMTPRDLLGSLEFPAAMVGWRLVGKAVNVDHQSHQSAAPEKQLLLLPP